MISISHIINPVLTKEASDLHRAQPITFQTMRTARCFAEKQGIKITQYATSYSEDREICPLDFERTPFLQRSVLDIGKKFEVERKLPLIRDILSRLYENSDADYFIYSNVDIAVMPFFYVAVSKLIARGHDAFVINRRTISDDFTDVDDIPLMYLEIGKKHKGHDCFVFTRKAYKRYVLGDTCIGASLVGRTLLINLICNSANFREFRDCHLTFHLGDDRTWNSNSFKGYTAHNLGEMKKVIKHYAKINDLPEHPLIQKAIEKQDINYWLGNTSNRKKTHRPKDTSFYRLLRIMKKLVS